MTGVEAEPTSSNAKVNSPSIWKADARDTIRDLLFSARRSRKDCIAESAKALRVTRRECGDVRRNAWGSVSRPSACHEVLPKNGGGAEGIRTPYLYNANVALYQLSYSPTEAAE